MTEAEMKKINAARHQHICREAAASVQREWHRYSKSRRGSICDANGVEYSPTEQAVWLGVWASLYDEAREAWTAANPHQMRRVPIEDVECACGLNRASCARHQVAGTCDQD